MRVLVVGIGGLGCPASLALAAAGVQQLTLVDHDEVDSSNLHRQPWHRTFDVSRPKVESAAEKLMLAFPALKLEALQQRVDEKNVDALFLAHDAVIDGTDGASTKFLLSDAAVRTGKRLVYGGVLRLEGQAMLIRPGGPCLRCLFEAPPARPPTCAQAGVLGSLAGVIGALQARLLLAPPLSGDTEPLHRVDARSLTRRQHLTRRVADCPACGTRDSGRPGEAPASHLG